MKKSLLFLALLVLGFAACKKGDTIYTSPYVPAYQVDGLKDVTIGRNNPLYPNYADLALYVNYHNGPQEKVSLSVEGQPRGMVVSLFDSSGYPSFGSRLYIADTAAAPGDYTLNLIATGSNSGRTVLPFIVHVLPAPVLNSILVGSGYNSSTTCGAGGFTQNILAVGGTDDQILFSNFDNTGTQIRATMNGSTSFGYIELPTQTVNGVTYSAGQPGYYQVFTGGRRSISINFYRTNSAGTTTSCNLSMSL